MPRPREYDREKIVREYKRGDKVEEIAERHGCYTSTVSMILKDEGVRTRGPGGRVTEPAERRKLSRVGDLDVWTTSIPLEILEGAGLDPESGGEFFGRWKAKGGKSLTLEVREGEELDPGDTDPGKKRGSGSEWRKLSRVRGSSVRTVSVRGETLEDAGLNPSEMEEAVGRWRVESERALELEIGRAPGEATPGPDPQDRGEKR